MFRFLSYQSRTLLALVARLVVFLFLLLGLSAVDYPLTLPFRD